MSDTDQPTEQTIYTFTCGAVKALLIHIPKDEVRFYMVGLHINAQDIASATDGHRALRVRVAREGPCRDFIIPRALVEMAAKEKKNKVMFTFNGDTVTLKTLSTSASMPRVDGTFPDVDRVLPMVKPFNHKAPHCGKFNLEYHLDARRALDFLQIGGKGKFAAPVAWTATNVSDTQCAGYFHGDGFAMVLMPLRD